MIVQCENCQTKFNLDDTKIPEDGAWVRCSNCKDVFQVLPAAEDSQTGPEEGVDLDLGGMDNGGSALPAEDEGLDLEADLDLDAKQEKKLGGFAKAVFWLIGVILVLTMVSVGGLVAMDRLGMATEMVDRFRALPLLNRLLRPASMDQVAETSDILMALAQVRGYFRTNQKVGRVFIIQGLVENKHKMVRTSILVRGRLHGAQSKVVRQAVVYAGPMFTPEELGQLSLEEIQARLGKPAGPDGSKYVVTPGGSIPFMIVFANLPTNLREFTAEVVRSEPLGDKPPEQKP